MNLYIVSKFLHSDQREGDYYESKTILADSAGVALDAVYPKLEQRKTYKVVLTQKDVPVAKPV